MSEDEDDRWLKALRLEKPANELIQQTAEVQSPCCSINGYRPKIFTLLWMVVSITYCKWYAARFKLTCSRASQQIRESPFEHLPPSLAGEQLAPELATPTGQQ